MMFPGSPSGLSGAAPRTPADQPVSGMFGGGRLPSPLPRPFINSPSGRPSGPILFADFFRESHGAVRPQVQEFFRLYLEYVKSGQDSTCVLEGFSAFELAQLSIPPPPLSSSTPYAME